MWYVNQNFGKMTNFGTIFEISYYPSPVGSVCLSGSYALDLIGCLLMTRPETIILNIRELKNQNHGNSFLEFNDWS